MTGEPSLPEQWQQMIRRGRRAMIGVLLGTLLFLSGGIATFLSGEFAGLIIALFFVMVGGGGAAHMYLQLYSSLRRPATIEAQTEMPDAGVFIPTARSAERLQVCLLVAYLLIFAAAPLVISARGNAEDRWALRAEQFSFVFLILAALVGFRLLMRILHRSRRMGLSLGPRGVHHVSWWGECLYRWEWIERVVLLGGRQWLGLRLMLNARGRAWAQGSTRDGNALTNWGPVRKSMTRIYAGDLDIYPALVPYAIRFYLEHPELRHELSDHRGADRLKRADLR